MLSTCSLRIIGRLILVYIVTYRLKIRSGHWKIKDSERLHIQFVQVKAASPQLRRLTVMKLVNSDALNLTFADIRCVFSDTVNWRLWKAGDFGQFFNISVLSLCKEFLY